MSDFNAEVTLGVYIDYTGEETKDRELTVWVALHCTHRSRKGFINGPPEACYPPESAEFALEYFDINGQSFSRLEFAKIFGLDLTNDIFEDAYNQALDSGRF